MAQTLWRRKTKIINSESFTKRAPIILLDEATASLDEKRNLIQSALGR